MKIEAWNAHPEEWQAWLYRSKWWLSAAEFREHIGGFIIQGEDHWRRHSGNHMDMRLGDWAYGALWPRFARRDALAQARDKSQTIHAFGFQPALSTLESIEFAAGVQADIGKPYDAILTGLRGLRALARLAGSTLPIVDFNGSLALMCYEAVGRRFNDLGRFHVNVEDFGPPDLWRLARRGFLTYRGVVKADDPAHEC